MLRPGNVATPATAATVLVPERIPVLGLVPIATVMFPVNPVAVLLLASSAVPCTAGVIAAPAVVLLGCTENTNWVAAPALSMLSPGKEATPPTAAWMSVPESVPPPGFVPIATVMFPVNPVAVLLLASSAVTCTAGVIAAPALVPDKVPVLGLVPIATVTFPVNPVAVLPLPS